MRIRNAFALVTLGFSLAACVAPTTREASPLAINHHNFEYTVVDREGVQLVQAFDDGSKTYLQFTHAPAEPVVIASDADGKALAYLGDGPYLVVPGVYERLALSVGAHSTVITNDSAVARASRAAGSVTPVALAAPAAQDDKTRSTELEVQIGVLQARIRELQAALDEAHASGRAASVFIGTDGSSPRVVIRFANHSSVVQLDSDLLQALGNSAMAAKRIYLHGRTDSFTLTASAAELAVRRAVAVKQLLVVQGVAPENIRIFYRGAGGFAADNATREGKAANRRVEIQMIKG